MYTNNVQKVRTEGDLPLTCRQTPSGSLGASDHLCPHWHSMHKSVSYCVLSSH